VSTAATEVAAVLLGDGGEAGVGEQSEPVGAVHRGPGALAAAVASTASHLWVLGPGVAPRPDALARLWAGRARAESEPALLAGLVEDAHGRPLDGCLPAGTEARTEEVVRLVPQRLLPIRSAPFAHVLIVRSTFAEHGLPDRAAFGSHAPVEWAARVLAGAPGYLVCDSVAVLAAPPGAPLSLGARARSLPATVRMARGTAWTRGESVRALAALARGAA